MSTKNKKKLSANARWGIAFLVEILILVVMVVVYVAVYFNKKYDKVQYHEINEEDLAINEGSNEAQKGYTTIALFGIDSRSNTDMEEGNRI